MRDPVDALLFNDSPAPTGSGLLELLDEMAWFIESSFDSRQTVYIWNFNVGIYREVWLF
jgi:hypothetical protein